MNAFIYITYVLAWISCGICFIGYVAYKFQVFEVDSWEAGVKKTCTWLFDWIYEESTGKKRLSLYVNTSLILTKLEALKLTKMFDGHPYDIPSLVSYIPNCNGISWFDIAACGFVSAYKNLKREQLLILACHTIQNYFMETRGTQVALYIKIASSGRLYFAIALSEESRQFLENQEKSAIPEILSEHETIILEEEADVFDNSTNCEP